MAAGITTPRSDLGFLAEEPGVSVTPALMKIETEGHPVGAERRSGIEELSQGFLSLRSGLQDVWWGISTEDGGRACPGAMCAGRTWQGPRAPQMWEQKEELGKGRKRDRTDPK